MTVDEYLNQISSEKQEAFKLLRETVKSNIPHGFEETIQYQMIAYVVPLNAYPKGYHCSANTPLPFISIAAQKNFIALYHMGIYADQQLYQWFIYEYSIRVKRQPDVGKSCIRFKKYSDIPFDLIGQLCKKMTVQNWIDSYESHFLK